MNLLGDLHVTPSRSTHNKEPVDDPPDKESSEGEKFSESQANVPDVESVDPQITQKNTENQCRRWILPLTTELHIELHSLIIGQILLEHRDLLYFGVHFVLLFLVQPFVVGRHNDLRITCEARPAKPAGAALASQGR